MFTWARIPFVRITLFFTGGILLGLTFPGNQLAFSVLLVVVVLILLALNRYRSALFLRQNQLYGLSISMIFISLGYLSLWQHNEVNNKHNLLYTDKVQALLVEVRSEPEARANSCRVLIRVESIRDSSGWQHRDGRLLVYLEPKDSLPEFGDKLIIRGSPERVGSPANPHEFDYRRYLENQQIYHTQWVQKDDWRIVEKASGFDIFRLASQSRSYLENILGKTIPDDRTLGILQALVLGNKADLDPETKEIFASAGAMHVLAVSGLHVGIIYLILVLLLKPLSRRAPLIASLLIIFCLWIYAFITGFSPSVLRAVTMFAIIEVGRQLGREASVFNSLALSAFILLWINPYLVTQVGFQLSYIAVTGILLLYKPILNLLHPKGVILRFIWQVSALSIAAQVTTAPLAAFYFHKFPTYFLISNLIVIPAVTILVWGGIILLVAGIMVPAFAITLGKILEFLIQAVETLLGKITALPLSSIQNISFDGISMILIYVVIALVITIVLAGKRKVIVYALGIFTLMFFGWTLSRSIQQTGQKQIVFYSLKNGHWAIDFVRDGRYSSLKDSLTEQKAISYSIAPNRINSGLRPSGYQVYSRELHGIGNIIVWEGKKILVAESCVHDIHGIEEFDYVLHPRHPRYKNCYSDRNLLIRLVNQDGFKGHDLQTIAYVASL